MSDIKKILKSENLLMGGETVLKALRSGDLEKAFLASNAPEQMKGDILQYAKISGVEVEQLDVPNDELGILCKKPFSIACLGLKKTTIAKKKH